MRAQAWVCLYCGNQVTAGYAHKCAQFGEAATFYEGTPLPPMPDPVAIRDIVVNTKWTGGPLNEHDARWAHTGAMHGFLAGWRAGFAVAASAIEARRVETEGLDAKHKSATVEDGDAQ